MSHTNIRLGAVGGGHGRGMSTPEKDPQDWVTGDEPMTGPQKSYLETLAHDAGEEVPDDLSKADASAKIDELREKSDRVG